MRALDVLVLSVVVDDHIFSVEPQRHLIADGGIGRSGFRADRVLPGRRLDIDDAGLNLLDDTGHGQMIAGIRLRSIFKVHFDIEPMDVDDVPGFIQLHRHRCPFFDGG